jgi:hypothetical protein
LGDAILVGKFEIECAMPICLGFEKSVHIQSIDYCYSG